MSENGQDVGGERAIITNIKAMDLAYLKLRQKVIGAINSASSANLRLQLRVADGVLDLAKIEVQEDQATRMHVTDHEMKLVENGAAPWFGQR